MKNRWGDMYLCMINQLLSIGDNYPRFGKMTAEVLLKNLESCDKLVMIGLSTPVIVCWGVNRGCGN